MNIILRVLCLQPALFCQRTQDSPSLCPTTGLTILASDVWAKQSMISIHAFVVWLSHNCFKIFEIFEMLSIFPVIFLDEYFNHILLVDIFWLGILGIVVSLCSNQSQTNAIS